MIPDEDIVFLAHFTCSGIESVLDMEVSFFERMLKASGKVYEETKLSESKIPQYSILVELKED